MVVPTRQRLDRDAVIDAAMSISRSTPEQSPQPVTGATLGRALSVDRSAVWRHFVDKNDLLRACGDRLLEPAVAGAERLEDPWDRIVAIFEGVVESYRRHPLLASEAMTLLFWGRSWRRLAEVVVSSLNDLGLQPEDAARFSHLLMELTTSHATSLALYEGRPPRERELEFQLTLADLKTIDPVEYPHLAAAGPLISKIDQQQVTGMIISSFRIAVEHTRARETT